MGRTFVVLVCRYNYAALTDPETRRTLCEQHGPGAERKIRHTAKIRKYRIVVA